MLPKVTGGGTEVEETGGGTVAEGDTVAEEAGGCTVAETNEDGTVPEETGGCTAAEEAGSDADAIAFGTIGGPVAEDRLVRADICLFLQ